MKLRSALLLLAAGCLGLANTFAAADQPRVLVLTDIENEPDDAMSLVRFLTYANHFEIEGLVATTSLHQRNRVAPQRIQQIVQTYGKVRDNLEKHEPGYPKAEQLLALISEGKPLYGMNAVGETMDSPGSELIIKALDRDDPRPLWIPVWGGPNCLAQALFKLRATRTPEALAKLVAKLRVYTISDQDDSGPWLRKNFPGLFYIVSPGIHPGGAYHHATWTGISGDNFHGRFTGPDFTLVDVAWLNKNIRAILPFGAEYPPTEFIMEGDTPSFLSLINNGLGSPENPNWGSWGGRYELYTPRTRGWFIEPETRPIWTNAEDEVFVDEHKQVRNRKVLWTNNVSTTTAPDGTVLGGAWYSTEKATIWRWRTAYQNDFAARMQWTVKPYAEANHPPLIKLTCPAELTAKLGERVNLSAVATDPDGDALSYQWFSYPEAGSFLISSAKSGTPIEIENEDKPQASFIVPNDPRRIYKFGTLHLLLAVTDHGTPALTRYKRVIVTVTP